MKVYGSRKATEFTKKQIGAIYAKAKNGELKVEKWYMAHLYNLADYYGYDDNRSVEDEERSILNILALVFNNELSKAQEIITEQTDREINLLSRKRMLSADRSFL